MSIFGSDPRLINAKAPQRTGALFTAWLRSRKLIPSLRVGTGGRHRPALDESLRLDVGSMTPFLSDFLPRSEATKQSILRYAVPMDCFAALAMTDKPSD